MEARHRPGGLKRKLPHAGMNVVERSWETVEVGVQGRRVRPEVVADGRCPLRRPRQDCRAFLSCWLAGLVFDLPA